MNKDSYSWPTLNLVQSRESLTGLQAQIKKLRITMLDRSYRDDDALQSLANEVRSNLSRLLLLRSCGYLEYAINTAVKEWTEENHSLVYKDFIEPSLTRGSKANRERINKMVGIFAPHYADEMKEFLLFKRTGELSDRGGEISEMIKFRNKISHGLSDQLDTESALDFAELALEVGDKIIEFMNPYINIENSTN